jgi:hypothetical protein
VAADTALKRLSAMDPRCPWRRALPIPDGTVAAADRSMALYLYARAGETSIAGTPRLTLRAPARTYTLQAEHRRVPLV